MCQLNITVFRAMAIALMCALLASCSDEEGFGVSGTIEGLDDTSVEMYYYAEGGVKKETSLSREGKFRLRGSSGVPALVTLRIPRMDIVASFVAEDGNSIEIKGSADAPREWKLSGNKVTSQMSGFVRDNAEAFAAGDHRTVNAAIARYIMAEPSSLTSGALLASMFYVPGSETLADSLLGLLAPEARGVAVMQNFGMMLARQMSSEANGDIQSMSLYAGRDSVVRLTPSRQSYAMIAVTDAAVGQRDSITPVLHRLCGELPARRFKAMEISVAPDSARWRKTIDGDSARWMRAWLPGHVAAPQIRKLSVPRVPYFIVCDSTGKQLYRGSSVKGAADVVSGRLGVAL